MALTCSLTAFVFGFSTCGNWKRLGLYCIYRSYGCDYNHHTERKVLTIVLFIMVLLQSPVCDFCDAADVNDFPPDDGNDLVPWTFCGWLLLVRVGYVGGDVSGKDIVPCTFCCWVAAFALVGVGYVDNDCS